MKIPYNENGRRNNSEKFVITATVTSWKTYYAAQVGFPAIKTRYNALGRVKARVDTMGNKTTMMTYRNESLGPNSGDVTTWLYDIASGCMTNKVYADGKGPTYSYTPDGKLEQRIWARDIITDYTYDGWNNLTNTVYSDNTPTVSLFYDAMGRQTEAHDAAGVTTFLYDSFGSLTTEIVIGVAGTNTIERFWDEYGRTAGYALNGTRQTTMGYDSATARIETMQVHESEGSTLNSPTPTQNSNCFVWSYYSGSDLKSSLAYPNALTTSWTYDANKQLLQVCNETPTNVISYYDYAYDAAGRRVQIGRSGSAMSENRVDYYGYNARSELTSAGRTELASAEPEYVYKYDDIGNRESSSALGMNFVYAVNNLNQYVAVDDFIPQFDEDGNQTLIKTATGIWSVTYNGENRPVLWTRDSSSTPTFISMSYDRMGRRVAKNDQRFVYDGYLQIADSIGNVCVWDPTESVATRPLARFRGHSAAYYTYDGNKNVSEVVGANDMVTAHYEYAPLGESVVRSGESALDNPWRFSSEYVDDDIGLVSYNFRQYDPTGGRWLSRDPMAERSGRNLYAMLDNAVPLRNDFLGLFGDGYEDVCVESKGEWEYYDQIGYVWVERCIRWERRPTAYKGHSQFTNNGTKCPFDYTEEDHRLGSSPYLPWGIWKHFRSREDLEEDLKKAISDCNPTAFQRLMHQYQDTRTHHDKGYSVWTLGHLIDGTAPDKDDKAWEAAEKDTVEFVQQWTESCQLTNECTCAWGKK